MKARGAFGREDLHGFSVGALRDLIGMLLDAIARASPGILAAPDVFKTVTRRWVAIKRHQRIAGQTSLLACLAVPSTSKRRGNSDKHSACTDRPSCGAVAND